MIKITRGVRLVRKQLEASGVYAVYQNSLKPLGYYDTFNHSGGQAFVISAGSAGEIGWSDKGFWAADDCFCFECPEEINQRYLFYSLQSQHETILRKVRRAAIPRLPRNALEELVINIPSLEEQKRIVIVLDKFYSLSNSLTDGLPAEVEARRKQYEHYRDLLLTFREKYVIGGGYVGSFTDIEVLQFVFGFAPVRLGDIAELKRGGNFQKKNFVPDGKPCIHYGQIYTHYGIEAHETLTRVPYEIFEKSRKAQPNDIVMAITSENVEDLCKCVAWLGDEDIAVSGDALIIHHDQNPRYLAHFFHSEIFNEQKRKLAYGVKVSRVLPNKLKDIIIPLPPLDEQERIAAILDKFYNLCNSLTEGLPAEIKARKKHYEYYRDKLLTFKQKS